MSKLESKLKDLNQMLIDDGYNGSNIAIQTLEEIREEVAINFTGSSLELNSEDELTFKEFRQEYFKEIRPNVYVSNMNIENSYNDVLFKYIQYHHNHLIT